MHYSSRLTSTILSFALLLGIAPPLVFANANSFATYSAPGLPQPIPDGHYAYAGGPQSLVTTVDVSDDFAATDINVFIDIADNNIRESSITLTAPDGTRITLLEKYTKNGAGLTTTYDDESFAPHQSLSAFDGKSVQGTWTLKITDFSLNTVTNATDGHLRGWKLIVEGATPASIEGHVFRDMNVNGVLDGDEEGIVGQTVYLDQNENGERDTAEISVTTDSEGLYQFTDLPLDDYVVRLETLEDLILISPVGSMYELRPGNGEIASDNNFAVLFIDDVDVSTYAAANLPKAIPDGHYAYAGGPQSLIVNLDIDDDFFIADLDVFLDLQNSNLSELSITLTAPDGTRVVLLERAIIGGADLRSITLDDEAVSSMNSSAHPRSDLRLSPHAFLSSLDTKSMQGTWTLKITDFSLNSTTLAVDGALHAWELRAMKLRASDIALLQDSLTLTEDQKLEFSYETTGYDDPFDVSIFRSVDEHYDASDTPVLDQTLTVQGSEGVGSFVLDSPDPDQPYILIVSDSEDGDESNNVVVYEQDVLEWFSPILHIFDSDFRPKEITSMVDESSLWDTNGIFPSVELEEQTTIPLLESDEREDSNYMNMRDASGGGDGTVPPVDRFDQYETAIYGRLLIANSGEGNTENLPSLEDNRDYTVLQYWFFYPYNNFIYRDIHGDDQQGNRHEGDWEMIQVIINPLTREPVYATYSWHYAGSTFEWSELLTEGSHPHVFVGQGGHANWNEGGVSFYSFANRFIFTNGDITPEIGNSAGVKLHAGSVLVGCSAGRKCESYAINRLGEWASFPGYWGDQEGYEFLGETGPASPTFILYGNAPNRWDDSINWANDPAPTTWNVIANSPVNLSIFDAEGNRVGALEDGGTENEIPGTYYFSSSDTGSEWATIFTDEPLNFVLEGTDTGTMDLFVSHSDPESNNDMYLEFHDVPLTSDFVGYVSSENGSSASAMQVDSDGDGTIDSLLSDGAFLTLQEAVEVLPEDAFMRRERFARKKLLILARRVETMTQKGLYGPAIRSLQKFNHALQREVTDVDAGEGEATKEQIENMVEALERELQILFEEKREERRSRRRVLREKIRSRIKRYREKHAMLSIPFSHYV